MKRILNVLIQKIKEFFRGKGESLLYTGLKSKYGNVNYGKSYSMDSSGVGTMKPWKPKHLTKAEKQWYERKLTPSERRAYERNYEDIERHEEILKVVEIPPVSTSGVATQIATRVYLKPTTEECA